MLEFFSEGGRRRVVLFEIDELVEGEQLGLRRSERNRSGPQNHNGMKNPAARTQPRYS